MKEYLHLCLVGMLCFASASAVAQSADVTQRLRACAAIGEDARRVACFENLGQEALAETDSPADAAVSEPKPPAAEALESAPEPVAATSAPTKVPFKGDRPVEEYAIVVSSCERNRNRETFFVLDNGEVWKQTGGKRVKETDCSFPATLRKDVFGYKMIMTGDDGAVRVKRIK